MDWLFERTIELAAWVAFILCLLFFCDAVWMLLQWGISGAEGSAANYFAQSSQAAIKFVGSALALGFLACIDRYVFDLPEESE